MKRNLLFYVILVALIGSLNPFLSYAQKFTYWQSGQFFFDDSSRCVVMKMNCPIESCETKINSILQTWNLAKDSIVISDVLTNTYVVFLSNFYATSRLELISSRLRIDTSVVFFSPTYYKNKKPVCSPTFEIIVKLKPNETIASLSNDLTYYNLTIARFYSYDSSTIILKGDKYTDIINVSNSMHQSSKYTYCIPNWIISPVLASNPVNDEFFSSQWSLHTPGTNGIQGGTNVINAWNYSMGCSNIKIALLDHGIDINHEDLTANLLPGYNFVNDNTDVAFSNGELHGTVCAGIIAAKSNNLVGISGVAPNCKIIPIKVFDRLVNTTVEKLALSIDYSWNDKQADIINGSWGFKNGVQPQPIADAVIRATSFGRSGKGTVVIFASGNNNLNQVDFPANFSAAIGVGGSTQCNSRKTTDPVSCDGITSVEGSNYGTGLDLVAPGASIITTDITGSIGYNGLTNNNYTSFSGTSAAAPHVAGIVGLMLSINSNLTISQVKQSLFSTASKVGGYSYQLGGGDLSFTWNPEMGYGKADALLAVGSVSTPGALGIEAYYTASHNPQNPPNTILRESMAWCNYFYSAPRCCSEILTISTSIANSSVSSWTGSWVIESNNPYVQIVNSNSSSVQILYDQLEWPSQYSGFNLKYILTGPCGQSVSAIYCFRNTIAGPYYSKSKGVIPVFEQEIKQPRIFPNPVKPNSDITIEIPDEMNKSVGMPEFISIVNLQGIVLRNQIVNSKSSIIKISSGGLSSGIYFLKLYFNNNETIFKLIVQ
jgi:subtilisin family serine protease